MIRRPTPVHRSITPAHMQALRDPTSTDFRRQRWQLQRSRLYRRLLFAAIAIGGAVLIRLFVMPSEVPATEQPAREQRTVSPRPAEALSSVDDAA